MLRFHSIRIYGFCLIFFAFWSNALGQGYLTNMQHLTVEDGLSGRYVKDVQQDQQGFIWVNSWTGLNRFDGFSFKLYDKAKYGFRLDGYDNLELDALGRLWMIKLSNTKAGRTNELDQYIDVFNPFTEELISTEVLGQAPFTIKEVKKIRSGPEKLLYIQLVSDKFYRFDGENYKEILSFRVDDFIPLSKGNLALIDKRGNNILQVDHDGKVLKQWPLPQNNFLAVADQYGGFITGNFKLRNEQKIIQWSQFKIGRDVKTILFNEDGSPNVISPQTPQFAYRLVQDQLNRWWLSDGSVLRILDDQFKKIAAFPLVTSEQKHINNLVLDRSQTAWISTGDGVYMFKVRKNIFKQLLVNEQLIDTRGIIEMPDGNLVVNQKTTYLINPNSGEAISLNIAGNRGLHLDFSHQLWTGTYKAEVFCFQVPVQQVDTFRDIDLSGQEFNTVVTNVFHQRRSDSTIFVGTLNQGLYIADQNKKQLIPFNIKSEFRDLTTADIHCFYENKEGIWIGTNKGLFLLEPYKGITKHLTFSTAGIEQQLIHAIHEDKNGTFWLGTFNHGLIEWNPKTEELNFYTTKDGLADNTIYAIYEDDFGHLWMPSNMGLMRMNKFNKDVYTYLEEDGIPHKEFNSTSHLETSDGQLIFGGLKGLVAFYPRDIQQVQKKDNMELLLSEVIVLGDSTAVSPASLFTAPDKIQIRLTSEQAAVRIVLAAFDPFYRDRSQFGWRESKTSDWQQLTDNTLEIHNIAYGNNQLWLRGRTNEGAWGNTSLLVIIDRNYPFYLSAYFIIPLLILIIVLFYFAIRKKSSTNIEVAHEMELEQKIEKEEKIKTEVTSVENDPKVTLEMKEGLPTAFEQWLAELHSKASELIDEGKFTTVDLAAAMNLSDRQLRRKMKQHEYMSPANFMREVRLKKAEQLLKNHTYATVSEVCFAVGFSTPKHFSRLFHERFDRRPSSYLEHKPILKKEEEEE